MSLSVPNLLPHAIVSSVVEALDHLVLHLLLIGVIGVQMGEHGMQVNSELLKFRKNACGLFSRSFQKLFTTFS
jgi:hypothetical protein